MECAEGSRSLFFLNSIHGRQFIRSCLLHPDNCCSNGWGGTKLYNERKGKSIIGATKERKENVLAGCLGQRRIGRRDATVNKQRNIRRCVRENFTDEVRVHDRRCLIT